MTKYLTIFLTIFSGVLQAQKTWSLQDCFVYAIENNISIKQIELSKNFAENSVIQSQVALYLPNVNANVNESFNFGNSIDPTTYQFVNRNTNTTSFGLNASYGLFEGLTKINRLNANKENLSATEHEIEEVKNNIKIYITNLYLQIIIANEALSISKEKIGLTQNQYKNAKALVTAGVQARGVLLDVEAQLANDELSILNAESNVEKALSQLKLLLQLDPYEPFEIQEIDLVKEFEALRVNPKNIATAAMDIMPQIKAAEFRKKAAEYDLKVAKGSLFPSLSLSGSLGTRFFSEAQNQTGFVTLKNEQSFEINDVPVIAIFENDAPTFSKTPFFHQLENNLSESISVGLNIPILGGWQRRAALANAKINILKTDLDIEVKKNKINEEVFNAYTDLRLAQKRYQAAQKSSQASDLAYNYANEKFKGGIMNSLAFETVKNRKISAEASFIQAKYDLFFKKLILDYYETGELKF
tara:strand:+ start:1125 stop:2537 length:1413 start_codon:yes stop_codon:yes gene_type:complete